RVGADLGVDEALEVVLHDVGVERLAVLERDTLAQIEAPGQVVDDFPMRRELADELAGLPVELGERVEDVSEDRLLSRRGEHGGVEIARVDPLQYGHRVVLREAGTGDGEGGDEE